MKPTVLVLTTVHWPDDTRIRERLIRTLSSEFAVVYASREPGPHDDSGLHSVVLAGGRLRRNLAALVLALRSQWDLLILHDPETLPLGLLARLVRRRPVVFDVHEDYPAVAYTRGWVPPWLRRVLASASKWALRMAERTLTITLAEPGYRRLFAADHPVFPNYPDTSAYPPVRQERNSEAVYLGDATIPRGVDAAVEACARAGIRLRLIGRVSPEVEATLGAHQQTVLVVGTLSNPDAIARVSEAALGLVPLRDAPNYRDSQPTKLLEYLALGLPVVASDLPGTRRLVEGLEAVILVPPGDVDALASGVEAALTPSMRQAAIRQAPSVRKRFRWPSEEVSAFHRSVLSEAAD